jgi:hypothetical protein
MPYKRNDAPALPMPARVPVPGEAYWRSLQKLTASQGRMHGCCGQVRIGRVAGGLHIGDDSLWGDISSDLGLSDSGSAAPTDTSIASLPISDTYEESLVASSAPGVIPYNAALSPQQNTTLATLPSSQVIPYSSQTQSLNAIQEAAAGGQTITAAQTAAALASGLTAAQITAAVNTAKTGASAPTSPTIIPGISNTALLVGSAIVLMVVASVAAKKR